MEVLELRRSPIPLGSTGAEINRDTGSCPTCFNLSSRSLQDAFFLNSWIFVSEQGTNAFKRANTEQNVATSDHAEYNAFTFIVKITDIPSSVTGGCESCLLLSIAMKNLCSKFLDFKDSSLFLNITLCKGNALRFILFQDTYYLDNGNDAETEEQLGFGGFQDGIPSGKAFGAWELYTSKDANKSCPWPTIGNSMDLEFPLTDRESLLGGSARHVVENGDSEIVYSVIKEWIASCSNRHTVCAQLDKLPKMSLPKRVIVVGDSSNRHIRLQDSAELDRPNEGSYIALSHCWGKGTHITTKMATVEQRKRNIPWDALSKTFQDAIDIARGLDIPYVWIDSLCIIQDDPQDLGTEISKMASIYSGATLVVAASSSADGSGGCLFHRQKPLTIHGTDSSGDSFEIYGREVIDHNVWDWSSNPYVPESAESGTLHPLMVRAWCFQERALATRVIHFTKHEVVFECLSGLSCECGAMESNSNYEVYNFRQAVHEGQAQIRLQTTNDSTTGKTPSSAQLDSDWVSNYYLPQAVVYKRSPSLVRDHRWWRNIATEFATKKITKRTDSLPALAGLATIWSHKSLGRYLAGIWEKDTLRYLTWMPKGPHSDEEDMSYVAPTWSWLSAHRTVEWDPRFDRDVEFFTTVDATQTTCHASPLNPFGEVEYGYIMLVGDIVRMDISGWDGDKRYPTREKWQSLNSPSSIDPDSRLRFDELKGKDIYLLRFSGIWNKSAPSTNHCSTMILAAASPSQLKRQPSHVQQFPHVYQRIGFYKTYPEDPWDFKDCQKQVRMYLV